MKYKGIWIVIVLILATGIGFTASIKHYVSNRQPETVMQIQEPETLAGAAKSAAPLEAPMAAMAPVEETTSDYLTRLDELDEELNKNHETNRAATDTHLAKVRLENELKLWQAEVDSILLILQDELSGSDREELLKQQQEWLRERESRAVVASDRQGRSNAEELEYTRSQIRDTRARAYELVERYLK